MYIPEDFIERLINSVNIVEVIQKSRQVERRGGAYMAKCHLARAPPEPIIIEVPVEKEDKLTLGTVQSKIKKGMNQTEVLEVLGSPNIVTKNKNGNEVWTYDKVGSSQSSTSGVSATYGQAQLNQGFWAFLFLMQY